MNIFDINIEKAMPYIIDAYTEIYGEKYKNIIKERVNNIIFFIYNHLEGVEYYYSFLKECKKKELFNNFIKEKNYDNENINNSEQIKEEYNKYLKEIELYKTYIDEEKERKSNIYNNKQNELLEQIWNNIPEEIKQLINNKCTTNKEKCEMLFGNSIDKKSYIEYFSEEFDIILKISEKQSDKIDNDMKQIIYNNRIKYFNSMGIRIEDALYDEYIKLDDVKKIIPSKQLIKQITKYREVKYEQAKKEFICTNRDFIKYTNGLKNGKEEIYSKVRKIATHTVAGITEEGFAPTMFFTVSKDMGGKLDYAFLHEICHGIECNSYNETSYRSGFEFLCDGNTFYNSYTNYRKYERLNENITDIYAIKAMKILHDKGIYILEPENIISKDVENINTSSITKGMIIPFLEKYKENIVQARLFGNMQQLFNTIGRENFEELNDVVNKVDYLVIQGLKKGMSDNNPLVKEYYEQAKRLEEVYCNVGIYKNKENKELDER